MAPSEEDLAWFRSTFHPIPKPALPDDCIEYSVQVVSSSSTPDNGSDLRLRLREVQKYATELQKQWLKTYIWQRQGFALELLKEDEVSLLRGRTEYGDSIEDEWVIVWLLRELTQKFCDIWVKVSDSDGEFLLIEASGTLPSWLEPDVAENRVWINDGKLKIIKPDSGSRSSKRTQEKLTLQDAKRIIRDEPKRLMHSTSMEEEAFYRLRNYPSQIQDNMHHALVTIPRKIAFLLKQKPAYISPVVEKFYLRDPIALKPLQSKAYAGKMIFPPEDLVTLSVCFPRVCYAQLKSQDFPPPAVFQGVLPSKTDSKAYASMETGMKVTCGFEMLISDSQNQDDTSVREIKLLLEDLESGDEVLPQNEEIQKWDQRQDDEKWLDISLEDLEKELGGNKGNENAGKKREFGDQAAQENLQRIVKQFEDFLNDDKAGPEGAGLFNEDSDDDDDEDDNLGDDDSDLEEDKEASFDEDEFTKMMQEMMGMPPNVMKEIMDGKLSKGVKESVTTADRPQATSRVQDLDDGDTSSSDEDDEDMETIMKQMDAELRESGALDLQPSIGRSQGAQRSVKGKLPEADEDDLSSDDGSENDIDINLAKNLLESIKSQAGNAGPGGNLMGMMGFQIPRDEPGGDAAGSSRGNSQVTRR